MSNVESSRFDFEQFQRMTALNGETIWAYLVDRHADRIGVKRLCLRWKTWKRSSAPLSGWPTKSVSAR
ncbi:hypothetical protein LP419_21330 [Massilia sp. H-1]|nr:hypothetical protein LP419_21330 [Massilia sp. H-1]